MKKWYLKCASFETPHDIFTAIKTGTKTIDTRPRNPESSKNPELIQEGDVIVITSIETGESIEKTVTFVHTYKTLEALAQSEDPNLIFPGTSSRSELLLKFQKAKAKWGSAYKKKLENYGIVAIGMG